uniref:Calnexin n=1 Tax=Arion vulgaris TaxID=1028688 RepID=A0A0B7AZQ2_9EUPU
MKIFYLLSLGILIVTAISKAVADDFGEDEDDGDDDSIVEDDVIEPVVLKERPVYQKPVTSGSTHLVEPFDSRADFLKRWVLSQAKKDGAEEHLAKYDGKWALEEPKENPIDGDLGLILKSKAKHHAISTKLDRTFDFSGKPFIVQYEVRFQNGMDCGGAYIKLLSKSDQLNLRTFTDKTPYTIMFGPDKCGNDHKLHFIFRHKNPKSGVYEEKHAEKTTAKLETFFTDRKTHLYTLTVNPDNTFEIKVDNDVVSSGDLLTNFSPPVIPPKEIEDPNDKKPAEWDDREKIPDLDAKKPDDWDESEPSAIVDEDAVKPDGWLEDEEVYIPDPAAVKPEDWDDEMDGEWEAPRIDNPKCKDGPGCGKWEKPTIANPKYKGTWRPPTIDNPNYKGEWKPRRISNPDYFEDANPYQMTPIDALGLELWSMTDDIVFDNFIISDNATIVEEFTAITWETKNIQEKSSSSAGQSIIQAIKDATNERPWLWAVFILVVVLPIVLIITYCCTGTSKPEDIDAHKKKFDDPTPDSPEVIEEEEEDAVKEDEEKEEIGKDEGAGGDQEDAGVGNTVEAGAAGDGSPAEDQADEGDDERDAEGSPKKSNSPRKRRTRKE